MKRKFLSKLVVSMIMVILLLPTTVNAYNYNTSLRINNQQYSGNYRLFTNTIFNSKNKANFNDFKGNIFIPKNNYIEYQFENNIIYKPVDKDYPKEDPVIPEDNTTEPDTNNEKTEPNKPTENIPDQNNTMASKEMEMVEYVNQARATAGLAPLAIDFDLSRVARVKSQDMKNNNYFSHTSPTYGSPFDMMNQFGIKYNSAAENIAINSSVIGAHNAFMNSTGHRNNILNPNMTHIGIGIADNYYTQMFIQK